MIGWIGMVLGLAALGMHVRDALRARAIRRVCQPNPDGNRPGISPRLRAALDRLAQKPHE